MLWIMTDRFADLQKKSLSLEVTSFGTPNSSKQRANRRGQNSRGRMFSLFHHVHTVSGSNPVSYQKVIWGSSSRDKTAGTRNWLLAFIKYRCVLWTGFTSMSPILPRGMVLGRRAHFIIMISGRSNSSNNAVAVLTVIMAVVFAITMA
jgi:hypothetical protein